VWYRWQVRALFNPRLLSPAKAGDPVTANDSIIPQGLRMIPPLQVGSNRLAQVYIQRRVYPRGMTESESNRPHFGDVGHEMP
jgi:hypothetical protein